MIDAFFYGLKLFLAICFVYGVTVVWLADIRRLERSYMRSKAAKRVTAGAGQDASGFRCPAECPFAQSRSQPA